MTNPNLGHQFEGVTEDYEGEPGNRTHITRNQRGTLPTSALAEMPGARGEVPGEHRNRTGGRWESFKNDISTNGIQSPLFIMVDPGQPPRLAEGNHRRDAAVELGMKRVPVHVRYFGQAEK